jgi:hypothetical protein
VLSYTSIACLIWHDVKTERTLKAAHVTWLMIRSRVVAVCCAVEVRVCVSVFCL